MTEGRRTKGKPDRVDIYVGKRLKVRRVLLGISQEKLAEAIGLTFQQVQKYEKGTNRISAGRLYEFARILGVEVHYFYDGLPDDENSQSQIKPAENYPDGDYLNNKELQKLARTFLSIEDKNMREEVQNFANTMAKFSKKKKT